MSEHTPNNQPGQGAGKDDLVGELREMGQQLEAAFRAAMESERAKQLQRDLASGVHELSQQVKTAVKTLQSDPRVQQAEERGKQVVSQARQSKVAQDLQETIVTGIAQLNQQLRKLVERIENESGGQASGAATQHVPVEHEPPPATGETTRLDDEDQAKL